MSNRHAPTPVLWHGADTEPGHTRDHTCGADDGDTVERYPRQTANRDRRADGKRRTGRGGVQLSSGLACQTLRGWL